MLCSPSPKIIILFVKTGLSGNTVTTNHCDLHVLARPLSAAAKMTFLLKIQQEQQVSSWGEMICRDGALLGGCGGFRRFSALLAPGIQVKVKVRLQGLQLMCSVPVCLAECRTSTATSTSRRTGSKPLRTLSAFYRTPGLEHQKTIIAIVPSPLASSFSLLVSSSVPLWQCGYQMLSPSL